MKELDQVIKKRGFVYTQLFADTSGYVYRQDLNGVTVGFEAFLRKENTQFDCVSFPGDNAFGVWAWSCKTFDLAKGHL
jgi:hypothetical protein